jgi:MFS family permease
MENRSTQTVARQTCRLSLARPENDAELAKQRLDALLAANAENAREKALYRSEREKTEAALMENPLSVEKTFAFFGLLLGAFLPSAMFIRFLAEKGVFHREDFWIVGVLAVINLITATVGFFSGKLIGRVVRELEKFSWSYMLFSLPFIGILWGILAGGAGGVIIFVIGAFFGAALGAAVGSVALPAFTIFHRLFKRGDKLDRKHFLPLAFGITFIISAFILGL